MRSEVYLRKAARSAEQAAMLAPTPDLAVFLAYYAKLCRTLLLA